MDRARLMGYTEGRQQVPGSSRHGFLDVEKGFPGPARKSSGCAEQYNKSTPREVWNMKISTARVKKDPLRTETGSFSLTCKKGVPTSPNRHEYPEGTPPLNFVFRHTLEHRFEPRSRTGAGIPLFCQVFYTRKRP